MQTLRNKLEEFISNCPELKDEMIVHSTVDLSIDCTHITPEFVVWTQNYVIKTIWNTGGLLDYVSRNPTN